MAAHDHRFGMSFRELVAVVSGNQRRCGVGQSHHWQLHELRFIDHAVEQAERIRIDAVFGIVHHHHARAPAFARLDLTQSPVKTIQTVRLVGRSADGMDHSLYALILASDLLNARERSRIVLVATDENSQLFVLPGRSGMAQRRFDHALFTPCRNEDDGRTAQTLVGKLRFVDPPRSPPSCHAEQEIQGVHRPFVRRSQQEKESRE